MRRLVALVAGAVLALTMASAASATPSDQTFHGIWTGSAWSGCQEGLGILDATYEASGTWNVTLKANGTDAQVKWNTWDPTGHYTFGGNKVGVNWTVDSVGSGPSFTLQNSVYYPGVFTLDAGGNVTATFDYGSVVPGCTSAAYGELVH